VPLRIATQSGTYYEVHLVPNNTGGTSGATAGPIYLNPNNTTYGNAFVCTDITRNSSGLHSGWYAISGFRCGMMFSSSVFYITNFTQYKNVKGFVDSWGHSEGFPALNIFDIDWRDTTTPWTSLGTITFPQATSGYILVRRLA
jgi:hypothetical protein